MARKVFFSFLGAGDYKPCVYEYEQQTSKVVTYVQSAIINLLAGDFDKYLIFCTKIAESRHFENLNTESSKDLRLIIIPDGISETEIWDIFQIVFDQLQEEDEILYDVTHSFRSLPMLGIVLLQYAKFLKNINVRGIFYGAFEKLGNPSEIEKNYPIPSERKVPLLNLTSFSLLQDWTIAGNNFLKLGNAEVLEKISSERFNPILKESSGKDVEARKLRYITNNLKKISLDFRTNRGKDIYEGKTIAQTAESIKDFESSLLQPFIPILKKLEKDISEFKENDADNLMQAVQWCINKGLIQEGITLLQEGLITIICAKIKASFLDITERKIISDYLSVGFVKPKEYWRNNLKTDRALKLIEDLNQIKEIKEIAKEYDALTKKRNDINHGGFNNFTESSAFEQILAKSFSKIKKILDHAH